MKEQCDGTDCTATPDTDTALSSYQRQISIHNNQNFIKNASSSIPSLLAKRTLLLYSLYQKLII